MGIYDSWTEKDFDPDNKGYKRERYEIKLTGNIGCDTMRDKFSVKCLECNIMLHDNTTWPSAYIEKHEQEKYHGNI